MPDTAIPTPASCPGRLHLREDREDGTTAARLTLSCAEDAGHAGRCVARWSAGVAAWDEDTASLGLLEGAAAWVLDQSRPWTVAGSWSVVTTLDSGETRRGATSEEEAVRLFADQRAAWKDDDRLVAIHVEGPDGERLAPTIEDGPAGRAYRLPLVRLGGGR